MLYGLDCNWRFLGKIRILLPMVLSLSWCSTIARHISQSSAVKTSVAIPGLVIRSVTMCTWLLVCVVSLLVLVCCTPIVVITVVLLIATIVLIIVVSVVSVV